MNKSTFTLDALEGEQFEGYTTGESWNGWATPIFNFDQAQAIVHAWRRRGWAAEYDAKSDSFSFAINPNSETGVAEETDSFSAIDVVGTGYYAIGTGVWIWETIEYGRGDKQLHS